MDRRWAMAICCAKAYLQANHAVHVAILTSISRLASPTESNRRPDVIIAPSPCLDQWLSAADVRSEDGRNIRPAQADRRAGGTDARM